MKPFDVPDFEFNIVEGLQLWFPDFARFIKTSFQPEMYKETFY